MAEIVVKLVNGELAGKTAQSIAKEVNAAALALKKAEIGTKEWVTANKKLEETKQLQSDLKKQIEGTTQASDLLKAAWNKLPGAQYFNQIGQSLGLAKSGVGGLISSMGMLKTAIVSTGVGALVVLIGSLVTWFSKTEEGADKLKSALYPLQVLFAKLTGIVADLGGKVFKKLEQAFQDPVGAIKELGQAIYDNIISRIEALGKFGPAIAKIFSGDFMEGFKDLGNATIQLTTGIEDGIDKIADVANDVAEIFNQAYKNGQKLLELENAIEDAEIALTVSRAKLNVEIAKAGDLARNTLKTDEERLAAARKVQDLQQQSTSQEENLLKLKLQRLKLEQDIDGILSDDERLERAKMEADLIQIQADNIEKNRKARAIEINLIEEIAKREAEIGRNIATLKIDVMEEGLAKEIAAIESSTQQKINVLTGSEDQIQEQRKLLLEIQRQEIQALNEKYDKEEQAKLLAKKTTEHELALTTDLNLLNERRLNEKIYNEQYQIEAEQLALDFQARKLQILKEAHGVENIEYQKAYATYLQMQQSASDRAVAIKKREIEEQSAALNGSLSTFGGFFGALASMQKQGTEQWKAFATAQALMSAIQSSTNAYQSTAAIPIVGPVLAPIAAGVALAAGMLNVRRIQNTKAEAPVKKASRGMLLRGASHAQGGIPIEAEGDEIILTKGVYRNSYLRKMASDINVAAGGIQFAYGGPVNPLANQSSNLNSATQHGIFDNTDMLNKLDSIEQSLRAWPSNLKVINVATETEGVIKTVNSIKDDADV